MKRYTIIIIASALTVIAASCKNDIETEQIEPIPNFSNYLTFNSLEDFKKFSNDVLTMTDSELDVWERTNNFVSYRTVLNQAFDELDSMNTKEEIEMFKQKYSDILVFRDEEWVPRIEVPFYQKVANREGIYETNGFVNKVVENYILTVEKKNIIKLKDINRVESKEDESRHRHNGVRAYQYMNSGSSNTSERIMGPCSTYMTASYFNNHSGCRNDRRVSIKAHSYIAFSAFTYGDFFQPRAAITLWGSKRRGTWCDWHGYDTRLSWRNVSYTIKAYTPQPSGTAVPEVYNQIILDRSTSVDAPDMDSDIILGAGVLNQHIIAFPFTRLHAEGTSRGVGDNWAIIDCD